MKKIISALMCIAMLFGLCACGNIVNVKSQNVNSKVYTQQEIDEAANVVKKYFFTYFGGCNLQELYYAGDDSLSLNQDFAERNNADQVIVLNSSFYVEKAHKHDSLSEGSTYHWHWILVRKNGGSWVNVSHGY